MTDYHRFFLIQIIAIGLIIVIGLFHCPAWAASNGVIPRLDYDHDTVRPQQYSIDCYNNCFLTTEPDKFASTSVPLGWIIASIVIFIVLSICYGVAFYYFSTRLKNAVKSRTTALSRLNEALLREIEERKIVEASLRDSEQRFRNIFDHAAVGMIQISTEGKIIRVNMPFQVITGYSEGELAQKPCDHITHPEDVANGLAQMNRLINNEIATCAIEKRFIRKDSKIIWVKITVSMVKDDAGKPDHLIGVVEDITIRKEMESRSKQNEMMDKTLLALNQMVECSASEIMDYALDAGLRITNSHIGYIYFYNEETKLLTLYSWSRGIMKECAIMEPQVVYELEKTGLWGEAIRQRKPMITNEYGEDEPYAKGLPEGHVPLTRHMNVPIFNDDRIVALIGVGNKKDPYYDYDVRHLGLLMEGVWRTKTRKDMIAEIRLLNEDLERKVKDRTRKLDQALDSVKKSELKFRTIFDSASDVIFIHDMDGQFIEVNQMALARLGYDRKEIAQKRPSDIVRRDCLRILFLEMEKLNQQGHVIFEIDLLTKDNGLIPMEINSRLVNYEGTTAVLSVARDITERKKAEKMLRESEERFRTLFNHTPAAIVVSSYDGRFLAFNDAVTAPTRWRTPTRMGVPIVCWPAGT